MQKYQVKNKETIRLLYATFLEYVWKFYNVILQYLSKFILIESI